MGAVIATCPSVAMSHTANQESNPKLFLDKIWKAFSFLPLGPLGDPVFVESAAVQSGGGGAGGTHAHRVAEGRPLRQGITTEEHVYALRFLSRTA